MRKFRFVLLLLISISFFAAPLAGQTRRETKEFKSLMTKGNLKVYEKFLTKYPASTYAPKVIFKRDSTLFNSLDGTLFSYIDFMRRYPNSSFIAKAEYLTFQKALEGRYVQNDALKEFVIIDSMKVKELGGKRYLFYSYENFNAQNDVEREFVANLIGCEFGDLFSAMFSGKIIGKRGERTLIEGISLDRESNKSFPTRELTYLLGYLDTCSFLIPISEGDLLTDQALEWWYSKNSSKRQTIDFGKLPEESSIVTAYKGRKDIERSTLFNAAFFDIRGSRVICLYQKSSKQYILVWCEPEPINKKEDKLLNSIYFENPNTLVLFYYIGKSISKVRINLSSGKLIK